MLYVPGGRRLFGALHNAGISGLQEPTVLSLCGMQAAYCQVPNATLFTASAKTIGWPVRTNPAHQLFAA